MLCIPLLFVILRIKVNSHFEKKPINGNFERNFPLKEDYFKLYTKIKEDFYHVNFVSDKVIELKDGWLFCGDEYGNNLSESLHFLNFNNKELDVLKNDLKEKKEWCLKNNINYYLAVAPNKESVYSNLIPIKKLEQDSKMQQLEKMCNTLNVNFINLGASFPKNGEQLLYHKTDTHWNEYAAYFGYKEIIETINKVNKVNISPIPISNYNIINSDIIIGDLDEIRGRIPQEPLVSLVPNNFIPSFKELKKTLPIPEGYEFDPTAYERRYSSPNKKLKIIVFGDSFSGYLVQFLRENFKETLFIWSHTFNKELILNEKPDIIIHEFVERNVDFLLDNDK